MKKIKLLVLLSSVLGVLSCGKPSFEESGCGGTTVDELEVLLTLGPSGAGTTRAGEDDGEGTLSNVSLFLFSWDGEYLSRYPFNEEDLSTLTYHLQVRSGESRICLFLGNLPEGTLSSLEGRSLTGLEETILSVADNYSPGLIPMAGVCAVTFPVGDFHRTVDMHRLMFRVDLGRVEGNFIDENMQGGDVYLRRVALVNHSSAFRVFSSLSARTLSEVEMLFGSYRTGASAFGGVAPFFDGFLPETASGAEYSFGGAFFNFNFEKAEGELYLDSEGVLSNLVEYEIENGEGLIYSEGEGPGSLEIAASMRGFPTNPDCEKATGKVDFSTQDFFPKIVFEVVRRKSGEEDLVRFYPVTMYYPQPGVRYSIEKVSLVGGGSAYSNFCRSLYWLSADIGVSSWDGCSLPSLETGYTDTSRTEIFE